MWVLHPLSHHAVLVAFAGTWGCDAVLLPACLELLHLPLGEVTSCRGPATHPRSPELPTLCFSFLSPFHMGLLLHGQLTKRVVFLQLQYLLRYLQNTAYPYYQKMLTDSLGAFDPVHFWLMFEAQVRWHLGVVLVAKGMPG